MHKLQIDVRGGYSKPPQFFIKGGRVAKKKVYCFRVDHPTEEKIEQLARQHGQSPGEFLRGQVLQRIRELEDRGGAGDDQGPETVESLRRVIADLKRIIEQITDTPTHQDGF